MADKWLRVGLIGVNGSSGWALNAHVPALQRLPETELIAVCTAHKETAQAAAQKLGVELAYHDHREMLANPNIDAVAVVIRVPMHHQLTMDALRAGKHVFTEYPLGANLKEAQEMADLARKMGVKTMVGLQDTLLPYYAWMKDLIAGGYIGQTLAVHLVQMGGGVLSRPANRMWQGEAKAGANPLTIAFGHVIEGVCSAVGEFSEVSAVLGTQVKRWVASDTKETISVDAPDNVLLNGKLENGAVISAHLGTHPYHGTGYRLEVYGAEGTLLLGSERFGGMGGQGVGLDLFGGQKNDQGLQKLPVPDHVSSVLAAIQKEGAGAYYMGQLWSRLAEAIKTGKTAEPDFDAAVRRQKLIDAIQQAAASGRKQKL